MLWCGGRWNINIYIHIYIIFTRWLICLKICVASLNGHNFHTPNNPRTWLAWMSAAMGSPSTSTSTPMSTWFVSFVSTCLANPMRNPSTATSAPILHNLSYTRKSTWFNLVLSISLQTPSTSSGKVLSPLCSASVGEPSALALAWKCCRDRTPDVDAWWRIDMEALEAYHGHGCSWSSKHQQAQDQAFPCILATPACGYLSTLNGRGNLSGHFNAGKLWLSLERGRTWLNNICLSPV